jgi:pimeloyl-ACP methyl ester carboxylesterase
MSVVTQDSANPATALVVNGLSVDTVDRGRGRPILFLHPGIGLDPNLPVLDRLAAQARVIAPTHPGFGTSPAPKSFTTVEDLAYFYLDLLDQLNLRNVALVGVSLGGWIAASIAVKSVERLSHVVLANAVGIKTADRETREIADIFAITVSTPRSPPATTRRWRRPMSGSLRATARRPRAMAGRPTCTIPS